MSSTVATASSQVLRLSIACDDRRIDVATPASVPLIEVIPAFAKGLGVLDTALVHGGYALHRPDGSPLDPARSAGAQGVTDGEMLTMVRGGLIKAPKVYDDVVEAVIDATTEGYSAWTARDSARTALGVTMTLLTVSAVLLLSTGHDNSMFAVLAGVGAAVLLVASIVLARVDQAEPGLALGLAAAAFAGVAGYLFVDEQPVQGTPLLAACAGLIVVGATAWAAVVPRSPVLLIPPVVGLGLGTAAAVTAAAPETDVAPFALLLAIAATLSNVLPWLALSSTRIRVISAQTDTEIFDPPQPINGDDVKRRALAGAQALIALRIALGLTVLGATPIVAGSGVAGACLAALAFLGMMFQSRMSAPRSGVLVLMALGSLGLAVTGLTVVTSLPDLRSGLLIVLVAATAVLVVLTLLSPRARLSLTRLADTVEVLAVALLLPLGMIAAGIA